MNIKNSFNASFGHSDNFDTDEYLTG